MKETERPSVKQVIVRKEDVSQRAEEPKGSSLFSVKQKMKVSSVHVMYVHEKNSTYAENAHHSSGRMCPFLSNSLVYHTSYTMLYVSVGSDQ